MSKLDDLELNIQNMSTEELLAYVRSVRQDRRTSKKKKHTKKTPVAKKKNADAMKALISSLSPEQIAKLREKMK